MKSLTISLLLTILNVVVNGFLILNLTNCRLLNADQINVQVFQIIIVICQLAGSVFCLTIVDFVERKVSNTHRELKNDNDAKRT